MTFKISYENLAKDASLSATSEAGDMTVGNLIDDTIATKWRADGLDATLHIDLGISKSLEVIGIFGGNFGPSGTWQISMSGLSQGGTEVYNGVQLPLSMISGYDQSIFLFDQVYSAQYIDIRFRDPSLNATGYMEFGELWIGETFTPTYAQEFNDDYSGEDGSRVTPARGGQEFVDVLWNRRTYAFTLPALTRLEADTIQDIRRTAGLSKSVLVLPTTDPAWMNKEAIMGLLSTVPGYTQANANVRRSSFLVKERL